MNDRRDTMHDDCLAFEAWLDDEQPAPLREKLLAHAATCARCAGALEADRVWVATLRGARPTAPAGFGDRVMARIALEGYEAREGLALAGRAAGWVGGIVNDPLPWWVRASARPAPALGLVALALIATFPDAILRAGLAARAWMVATALPATQALGQVAGSTPGVSTSMPGAAAAVWLGLVLPTLVFAFALYQWSSRIVLPRIR